MTVVRDRIRGFVRVAASQLTPHPRNWRTHPPAQRTAVMAILEQIGYAGALLARELPDGSLQLIDGHLRADLAPDVEAPVLLLDLTDEETLTLLAAYDPLAALAETDVGALQSLLGDLAAAAPGLQTLFEQLQTTADELSKSPKSPTKKNAELAESFRVVVECADEDQQREVYERLVADGLNCQLLNF